MIQGSKTKLHTKFQPNRTIFVEVIHFYRFSAGRLVGPVGPVGPISKKFLAAQRINMTSVYTKNQADISKR